MATPGQRRTSRLATNRETNDPRLDRDDAQAVAGNDDLLARIHAQLSILGRVIAIGEVHMPPSVRDAYLPHLCKMAR